MMVTTEYDAVADRSLEVIRGEKGKPVTITNASAAHTPDVAAGPQYNPATDAWDIPTASAAAGTATSRAVQIATSPLTLMVDAEGMSFAPDAGMSVEWAKRTRKVVDASAVAPNGEPMIYVVRLAA